MSCKKSFKRYGKLCGILVTLSSLLSLPSYGKVYEVNVYKSSKEPLPSQGEYLIYEVKRGDALLRIMRKFGIPPYKLKKVAKINNLKNPNLIYPGMKIKLPVSFTTHHNKKLKAKTFANSYLKSLKLLGAKVTREGGIFLSSGKVSFKKNPMITFNGKEFLLSKEINGKLKEELENLGIRVLNPSQLKELLEKELLSSFSNVQKDGNLTLGTKDILSYHYDYLAYDQISGSRVVLNLSPDTPITLKKLLWSYGIKVLEPKRKEKLDLSKEETYGELKILKEKGVDKLLSLVAFLTGDKGKKTDKGILFPSLKVYGVFGEVAPEEVVALELEGFKVTRLKGDFLCDAENLLKLIPFAVRKVRLVLLEPPNSGKRSTFKIVGLQVYTPKKEYFLLDSVEKVEEIPYLRYRGVNLIIY